MLGDRTPPLLNVVTPISYCVDVPGATSIVVVEVEALVLHLCVCVCVCVCVC